MTQQDVNIVGTTEQPVTGLYQLMPEMTEDEYIALKEDIRTNGVKVPLEFDADGNLIDGHHRYRAFSELISEGVEVPGGMYDKIVRRFETEQQKFDHVLSLNINRRHLTAEQRRVLVVKLRKEHGYTLQHIADVLHVSTNTVWMDLDSQPEEVKEELKSVNLVVGKDGVTRASTYAPRSFYTGETQIHQMAAQAAGAVKQEAVNNGQVLEGRETKYAIMIDCKDEVEQGALLEQLTEEGYTVRALVL